MHAAAPAGVRPTHHPGGPPLQTDADGRGRRRAGARHIISLRRPILDLKSHAEVCMYLAELCADPPIFASMLFVSSTRTTLPAKAHIRSAYVSRDSRPKFSIGVRRTVCRQIPKAGAGPATSADTASHARGWMLWVSCIVPAARASLCEAWTGSAQVTSDRSEENGASTVPVPPPSEFNKILLNQSIPDP